MHSTSVKGDLNTKDRRIGRSGVQTPLRLVSSSSMRAVCFKVSA